MLAEDKPKMRDGTPTLVSPALKPMAAPVAKTVNVSTSLVQPVITWEKLPADFILPDDPVDNIHQPSIAAALTDILNEAGRVPENAFTCTDYGIIATVNGKTIAKAPDWAYVANLKVPIDEVNRSYTPHLDGDVPTIVSEFLSATEGTEYSMKPDSPMGKWYFYEQVLKVPYYGIFEPISGDFQVYILHESGRPVSVPIALPSR
jgi:Putative restriction endonuclease